MSEAGHNLQKIAQVLKSNGTDGELILGFRNFTPEDINLNEPVFIYFDGLPVPFFIEKMTPRGNSKALVHLTDINCQEDVDEIQGESVYINTVETLSIEDDGFSALIGWRVYKAIINTCLEDDDAPVSATSATEGTETTSAIETTSATEDANIIEGDEEVEVAEIGTITDFLDIPNNPCIEVETPDGEAIVPLHEDFIISIDPASREIVLDIPEGLI